MEQGGGRKKDVFGGCGVRGGRCDQKTRLVRLACPLVQAQGRKGGSGGGDNHRHDLGVRGEGGKGGEGREGEHLGALGERSGADVIVRRRS